MAGDGVCRDYNKQKQQTRKGYSRLTLPKEPLPKVRPMIYWPIRACRAVPELEGLEERDRPGAAGAGRVAMMLDGIDEAVE